MPEDVTVVVAEATARDEVSIHQEHDEEVALRRGDTLRIRFAYRLHDQREAEEMWAFRLRVAVDGEDEAVSERIHRDRKFLSDSALSNVGIDIPFPDEGEHEITYEAFARLSHGSDGEFDVVSEETVTGTLRVKVD